MPLGLFESQGRHNIWYEYDHAGVQFHFAEEANEVTAVVRDERVLVRNDSFGQLPVRLAAQTEVIDMVYFKSAP
jgi:hypothetical protein